MKRRPLIPLTLIVITYLNAACSPGKGVASPQPIAPPTTQTVSAPTHAPPGDSPTTAPSPTASFTQPPVPTTAPSLDLPTATPIFLARTIDPDTVAYDFVAHLCNAQWSNSGQRLPCPGDPADTSPGHVGQDVGPFTIGGYLINLNAILTIQPQTGVFGGVFGAYPEFTVQPGDRFRALLACQPDQPACDVQFALEYYDSAGTLHTFGEPGFQWQATSESGFTQVDVELNPLAGQTVRFLLSVRENESPEGDHALWIAPYIWRDADSAGNTPTPGVIAGQVDMSAAPPYLLDPVLYGETGYPVAVVFFNLETDDSFWLDTTNTHPNYQMTVPPGQYHVVAYARGVGDAPYVSAGYTGQNPSCGQPLQVVAVAPDAYLTGIDIADWGWTCGVNHLDDYPPKPDEVSLP